MSNARPPASLPRGRQPRVDPEIVQQLVHLEREEVLPVQVHRVLEGPLQQPHVLEPEGPCLERNDRLNLDLCEAIRQRIGPG
jgi:hypothetical protein